MSKIATSVLVAAAVAGVAEAANPAYACSFCVMALGLVEEAFFQVNLERDLQAKCDGNKICELAVEDLVFSIEEGGKPEQICAEITLCTQDCPYFDAWPANPLPPKPEEWPTERKLAERVREPHTRDLTVLKDIFAGYIQPLPEGYDMWAHVAVALAELRRGDKDVPLSPEEEEQLTAYPDSCSRHNISCKIEALVDHKPLQDHDGDRFATKKARRMRGSDWRGYDCNDLRDDVYPGRKTYGSEAADMMEIDHNCNGISGGNETGSYEELFCSDYAPRGLVILGDSATAHFHVPPQWITADGWNLDQLLPDAMNEVDMPHCSWGTGHAPLEECPYQYPLPGLEMTSALSLYSQMRDRNRCNHNDFQNIGVNGARMTSSMQLVEAMARDQQNDAPLTVWLALIGNDVCNGHPGFDHMTKPDDFYTHTMETLTALDDVLPAGSHVVSLALAEGELLYTTMHKQMHPTGTSYASLYDFMNCLEENPCWGWLNTNATVRAETTLWSDALNHVYQNISNTATFKNFEYIYYSPNWVEMFTDYAKAGPEYIEKNLIEPADGFHPSQTGNALFAQNFYKFLEEEHPEALGAANPYNGEIDAMFFSAPEVAK